MYFTFKVIQVHTGTPRFVAVCWLEPTFCYGIYCLSNVFIFTNIFKEKNLVIDAIPVIFYLLIFYERTININCDVMSQHDSDTDLFSENLTSRKGLLSYTKLFKIEMFHNVIWRLRFKYLFIS